MTQQQIKSLLEQVNENLSLLKKYLHNYFKFKECVNSPSFFNSIFQVQFLQKLSNNLQNCHLKELKLDEDPSIQHRMVGRIISIVQNYCNKNKEFMSAPLQLLFNSLDENLQSNLASIVIIINSFQNKGKVQINSILNELKRFNGQSQKQLKPQSQLPTEDDFLYKQRRGLQQNDSKVYQTEFQTAVKKKSLKKIAIKKKSIVTEKEENVQRSMQEQTEINPLASSVSQPDIRKKRQATNSKLSKRFSIKRPNLKREDSCTLVRFNINNQSEIRFKSVTQKNGASVILKQSKLNNLSAKDENTKTFKSSVYPAKRYKAQSQHLIVKYSQHGQNKKQFQYRQSPKKQQSKYSSSRQEPSCSKRKAGHFAGPNRLDPIINTKIIKFQNSVKKNRIHMRKELIAYRQIIERLGLINI